MAKTKKKKSANKCDCEGSGGLFIPAGIMLGLGIGFLVENIPAWLFIGFGSGFLGLAISRIFCKCCSK